MKITLLVTAAVVLPAVWGSALAWMMGRVWPQKPTAHRGTQQGPAQAVEYHI